jgi:hypothetical protein
MWFSNIHRHNGYHCFHLGSSHCQQVGTPDVMVSRKCPKSCSLVQNVTRWWSQEVVSAYRVVQRACILNVMDSVVNRLRSQYIFILPPYFFCRPSDPVRLPPPPRFQYGNTPAYESGSSLLCDALNYPLASSPWGPNVLFPDTCNLHL